ncbi:MAG TPA: hypothetical protein DIU00_05280 [Phycisphaerales bacterium]|nr:hypothetical protein [Phycisphaerales bacterium]
MTPTGQDKAKSARLRYLVVLPAVLVVLAGAVLVYEYGLSNTQRQAETVHSKNKWAERIELPGLPNLHKVSDDLYRGTVPTAPGRCARFIASPCRAGAKMRPSRK